jgi:excisionase family DNA binding protein
MGKLVYTVKEVANILNIGLNKAYELIAQGKIPAVRVGRKFLVPKHSLESWLESASGTTL